MERIIKLAKGLNLVTSGKTTYNFSRSVVFFGLSLLAIDTLYKYIFGITVQTRQNCALYVNVPRWLFLIYENIVEVILLVMAGLAVSEILNRHFRKIKRFIPKNVFSAFLYASILPLCSCSVIPLIQYLRQKMPLRVLITFVVAAPLLNPYILLLSFTLLGFKYTLLRVLSSFILSASLGVIIQSAVTSNAKLNLDAYRHCGINETCLAGESDIYIRVFKMMKKILPFVVISGTAALLYESEVNRNLISAVDFANPITGLLYAVILGVPIFLCNGADILFLRPLMHYGHLPMGNAIAFSLASTAVCISSIAMLSKFLGRNLTILLVTGLIVITFLLGMLINIAGR